MQALINGRVLTPDGFKAGHSVVYDGRRIVQVCADDRRPNSAQIMRDLDGAALLPGFIDLQVNGGGGVLFNDTPTIEGIAAIGTAHRTYGTTGFFPTLISDDLDVMRVAIAAVDEAIARQVPGVLGIHLEGPFLNADKRGIHNADKFDVIGQDELELLTSLKRGKTIVTLAPELTSPKAIKTLKAAGVIVCAGHTMADYEQSRAAMDAGLSGFTHLFNAMPPPASRAPGAIAAALEDSRARCGIIADGHHVHPAMLRLALRAKASEQIFLVTDAMPSVGAAHKPFHLGGVKIDVKDGKCLSADGTLAGSDLDMMAAVRNAVNWLDVDLARAARMASTVPAAFTGLSEQAGAIRAGLQADFVSVSDDLQVLETWIAGEAGSV